MGKDHECRCGNKHCKHHHHHHEEHGGGGAGFALGVAIGAVVATLMAPDQGKKTRQKAQKKLDELTGGQTPEELLTKVKEVVGTVVDEIRMATEEGKSEAAKTKAEVLDPKKAARKKR